MKNWKGIKINDAMIIDSESLYYLKEARQSSKIWLDYSKLWDTSQGCWNGGVQTLRLLIIMYFF